MDADYSKAALRAFLATAAAQGLLNTNTAAGWTSACGRILEDVPDDEDVRKIDVPTAIKRYHNKHPGALKGTVLKEYQKRLSYALGDFVRYTDDPTAYKGRGRGPKGASKDAKGRAKVSTPFNKAIGSRLESLSATTAKATAALTANLGSNTPKVGMTLDFNMRPDFLAQIVVPRDMKVDEARRLSRFIMTLATDYVPKEEGEG